MARTTDRGYAHTDTFTMPSPMDPEICRRAALEVCRRAQTTTEAHELLDMLGIINRLVQ